MEDQIAQQQEFREYLDQSGLVKVLTRILVQLYDETPWPSDPLEYFRYYLEIPMDVNVDALRAENEELRLKNEELEGTVDLLMKQLDNLRSIKDDS